MMTFNRIEKKEGDGEYVCEGIKKKKKIPSEMSYKNPRNRMLK